MGHYPELLKTKFTVQITVCGEPADAYEELADLLDGDARVIGYETKTYTDRSGAEVDAAEVMEGSE